MFQNFPRNLLRWAPIVTALFLVAACGDNRPQILGEAVDTSQAVVLADLLSEPTLATGKPVIVSGTIGQVCRSAGCWFVLEQDVEGDRIELYVDLKPAASFTLRASDGGRGVTVKGRLAGSAPDLELHATGLVFE